MEGKENGEEKIFSPVFLELGDFFGGGYPGLLLLVIFLVILLILILVLLVLVFLILILLVLILLLILVVFIIGLRILDNNKKDIFTLKIFKMDIQ